MEGRIEALIAYAEIIDNRRQNAPTEADGYCENHHALPRAMGGTDDPENIVRLPQAEHIRAHIVLARAIGDQEFGRGMSYAPTRMMRDRHGLRFETPEQAAEARALAAQAQRGRPRSRSLKANELTERELLDKAYFKLADLYSMPGGEWIFPLLEKLAKARRGVIETGRLPQH